MQGGLLFSFRTTRLSRRNAAGSKKNTSTHILLILFLLLSCRLSSSLYMGIIKETTTINLKTRVYKYNFPYYRVFLFSRVCDCGYNVQQISLFKLSMRYDRAWRLCILLRGTVVADVWMWCCHQCSCLLAGGSGWLCVTWWWIRVGDEPVYSLSSSSSSSDSSFLLFFATFFAGFARFLAPPPLAALLPPLASNSLTARS